MSHWPPEIPGGPASLPGEGTGGLRRLGGNLCLPSAQKDEGMELRDPTRHQPIDFSFSAMDQLKTVFINWPNC